MACSFARVVELSSIFIVKLKQRCSSYPFHHFWQILKYFSCPLTHCCINVLWESIQGSVSRNLSIFNPVYLVSIIYEPKMQGYFGSSVFVVDKQTSAAPLLVVSGYVHARSFGVHWGIFMIVFLVMLSQIICCTWKMLSMDTIQAVQDHWNSFQ